MKHRFSVILVGVLSFCVNAQEWPSLTEENGGIWASLTVQEITGLIDAGADVNHRFAFDQTPLMRIAAFNEDSEVIDTLLKAGANPNAFTDEGTTALMDAARCNSNPEVIKKLLDAGADIDALELVNITVLMNAAAGTENPAIIEVLIAAGADVNAQAYGSLEGKTALMYAAEQNQNPAVIEALLEGGADSLMEDSEGNTAAEYAQRSNLRIANSGIFWKLTINYQKVKQMIAENTLEANQNMADLILEGDISLLKTSGIDIMSLARLDRSQLRILRNTIFAQYGYTFKSEDLQQHFSRFDWYSPKSHNVDSLLTRKDTYHIERIRKFEQMNMTSEPIISADELVGMWHITPILGGAAGFHSVYQFFPDGRFTFNYDQYRELPVIHSFSGRYEIRGNTLVLLADSQTFFIHSDDAEIVNTGGWGYVWTGGSEDTDLFQVEEKPFSKEFRLPVSNVGNTGDLYEDDPDRKWLLEAYPHIKTMLWAEIGDMMYFKYSPNPEDYS